MSRNLDGRDSLAGLDNYMTREEPESEMISVGDYMAYRNRGFWHVMDSDDELFTAPVSVDPTVLELMVQTYEAGVKVGKERGRWMAQREVRKALGIDQ